MKKYIQILFFPDLNKCSIKKIPNDKKLHV